MEAEPKKISNKTAIVVVVAVILACCCGAAALCSVAGLGLFYIARTEMNFAPVDSFEPPFPEESEQWLPTEIPQEWLETPETIEPDSLYLPTVPVGEEYDPTLPQGGRGDNELRKRVWDFVTSLAENDADCQNPLPAASIIVVTEEPDSAGVWEEGWTLFCENGPTPVYRVIFTPNSNGTINFSPGLVGK
ncbi:MAG: hypothetical protein LDL51_05895 [Chloroflexi bacterium]|nr:hypothetical protein [Chloroflexota bacterium]